MYPFHKIWVTFLMTMVCTRPIFANTFYELPIHQSQVQNGVKAVLQTLIIGGAKDRRTVSASFRITDRSGKPLTLLRNARITLKEAHASSPPEVGTLSVNSSPLFLSVTGLRDQDLQSVRHIVLDLHAANLPPTHVWKDVPIQSSRPTRPATPLFSRQGTQAKLSALYWEASSSLLGHRATPTIIAEVQENVAGRLPAAAGWVRLNVPGAHRTGHVAGKWPHNRTYEVMATYTKEGPLPRRATILFYSSAAVTQALKHYRFVFTGLSLHIDRYGK
jgi:hypothetical protein